MENEQGQRGKSLTTIDPKTEKPAITIVKIEDEHSHLDAALVHMLDDIVKREGLSSKVADERKEAEVAVCGAKWRTPLHHISFLSRSPV